MKRRSFVWPLCFCLLTLVSMSGKVSGQSDQSDSVRESAIVFEEIMEIPDKAILRSVLERAEAIAVFPSMLRGGFIFGGHRGRGIISVYDRDMKQWSPPAFLTMTGGSFGFQIGVEFVDIVLVIMNRRGLENLLQNQIKIGGDASVAAGPLGRSVGASTDIQLRAEILSYSRASGLFAGISLEGSAIREDRDANENFYGESFRTREVVLDGLATNPKSTDAVTLWHDTLTRSWPE